jgi:hypothetical protein
MPTVIEGLTRQIGRRATGASLVIGGLGWVFGALTALMNLPLWLLAGIFAIGLGFVVWGIARTVRNSELPLPTGKVSLSRAAQLLHSSSEADVRDFAERLARIGVSLP